jgi:predicted nucleotidyltransferase
MRFGLPESAIEQICAIFAAHPEIERAVLYGSRAKGNFKPGSDIDLTLFGTDLSHELLLDLLVELDDLLLPWMIDLSLFASLNHPALQEHITRVGVLFYQRQE